MNQKEKNILVVFLVAPLVAVGTVKGYSWESFFAGMIGLFIGQLFVKYVYRRKNES